MATKKAKSADVEPTPATSVQVDTLASALAQSLRTVVEETRPIRKKTVGQDYKERTPWTPPAGEPRLKLKRKMHQHGILVREDQITNEEIALMNKVRPGVYLDGDVKVYRRRDRGIDIDYPFRTPAQKLRLASKFGITDLPQLLQRIIDEADTPKPVVDDEGDAI